MNTARDGLADRAYALLRMIAGAMFAYHGLEKLLGLYAAHAESFGSQMWIGGLIELLTGIAIAIGAFARFAALIAAGEMAVAYFQFHWKLQFADGNFLPNVNGGELAVLYCFIFLVICAAGAGIWSFDDHRK